MKKKLLKFLLNTFLVLISVPFALTFLFREPLIQTISARLAANILTKSLGHTIRIDAIYLDVFSGINLRGLLVKDHHENVMLAIRSLKAKPAFADWQVVGPVFKRIEIDGAEFRYGLYLDETNYNLNIFLNRVSSSDTTSTGSGGSFRIQVKSLKLTNSLFHYFDENSEHISGRQMNYTNMVFDSINLNAKRFVLVNDSLNMQIERLSAIEKSGLKIDKLSAEFIISGSGLHAINLLIKSGQSNLDLDLDFFYNSYQSMAYFIDSVEMYGLIRPSTTNMANAGYFSEVLFKMQNLIGISGEVKGPVSHLTGTALRIHFGEQTIFSGNAMIRGLPDFFSSYMEADIKEFSSSTCDLLAFKMPVDSLDLDFTDFYDCDRPIHVKGDFKGYYSDFVTNLNIATYFGDLETEIAYTEKEADTIHFAAMLQGSDIAIGKILKMQDLLNKIDANIIVNGNGNSIDDIILNVDGFANYVDFMNYRYHNIQVNAGYDGQTVMGKIKTDDENLILEGDANVRLGKNPEIDFEAEISRFNLSELIFWDKDFSFSTHANIQLKGIDPATMTGKVVMDTTRFHFNNNDYVLNNFFLEKTIDSNQIQRINLRTDYADWLLEGKYNIMTLPERMIDLVNSFFEIEEDTAISKFPPGEFGNLYLNLKSNKLFGTEIVPGLDISPNTILKGSFDFDKNEINISSDIQQIIYQGITFKNNDLGLNTLNRKANLHVKSQRIILKDSTESDKSVFGIDDFAFISEVGNDSLNFGIYWDNNDSLRKNSAILEGMFTKAEKAYKWNVHKSVLYINDTLWNIHPENQIVFDNGSVYFKNLQIDGGKSSLAITGKLPQVDKDSLDVTFKDFNLSNLDLLTEIININLDGIVNGSMEYSIVGDKPAFISDLNIDGLAINNEPLGSARLMNMWDNTNNSIFINSQIFREGNSGKGEVASIRGYYFPFKTEESVDLGISFNRIKLVAIEPIISDFVSDVEGSASGELKLVGSLEKPVLTGKIEFYRSSLKVNYLNTRYSFSNDIVFEPDKINLGNIVIYDTLGNNATITGSLNHRYFQDPNFDFTITTDRLLFFNTTKKMNDLFFGSAITSGNIHVHGNPRDIKLNMDVTTAAGTNVFIPLDYSVEISDKDYIIFVVHKTDSDISDSLQLSDEMRRERENLKFDLNINMGITPDARVTIFLPSDMGRIESVGSGDINMRVNSDGDFTMIGDYAVDRGTFNFALGNLVSKRFELVKGGRISWSGDPYLANVRLKGLYKVRTGINNLGIEVDSSYNKRKVTVEAYIVLTDMLLNPNIRFEIQIPDLDPDLERAVFANLDTTNQAMMNEQMISLLVMGSFSFSNASNISLSSSYYTVLTNQLSSMLSKLSDAVDIGVNYKPGDNVSQKEFDVALSTQFFDDRVLVEGNFGMTYDQGQQNASNLVGDVDVTYNITKDGRWILKGYNHSNVNSWYNYNNYDKYSPYTQGVGVAYRKEFNRIGELFQRSRSKKKDTEQQKIENNENIN